ncbi:MAG: glycosyltransferase family 39 protein [Candidatus Omnitrophota bacterium]
MRIKMITFGMAAYAAIFTAFISKISSPVYIGLPFRKMYVPLAGWSVLCLYAALHSLLFNTDLKANLRKIIFLGLVLHLSFLLFYLNVQISGDPRLSKIYFVYIGVVTAASLMIAFFIGYRLRADLFFVPFTLMCIHLGVMYIFNGYLGYVAISVIAAFLCITAARGDSILRSLYIRISPFFKDERTIIAALFLLGTMVRIMFAMQILHATGGGSTFVDASDDGRSYNENAWAMVTNPERILKGGTLFPGIWDPGYMFFLAFIYKLAGHNFYAVTLAQSLLGGALSVLCYYIAKEIFGKRGISILTAILVSMSQLLIMYMIVLGTEALSIPLLAAFVLLYIRCFKEPENKTYRISAGIVLGGLCITRSLFMALPLFIFAAELFAVSGITLRNKIRNSLIVVLAASCLIAPVTLINYLNDGKVNLIVKSGPRLSSCWTGAVSPWPDISPDNKELIDLGVSPFNDPAGSIRAVMKEPGAVASAACYIYFKRSQNYFTWPCFGFIDPILLINNSRIPNDFASNMEFYVYAIFLIGLCAVFREARKRKTVFLIFAVMLYSILAHCMIITIVTVRYRTPIVPYLMMIGAAGLYSVYSYSRAGFSDEK